MQRDEGRPGGPIQRIFGRIHVHWSTGFRIQWHHHRGFRRSPGPECLNLPNLPSVSTGMCSDKPDLVRRALVALSVRYRRFLNIACDAQTSRSREGGRFVPAGTPDQGSAMPGSELRSIAWLRSTLVGCTSQEKWWGGQCLHNTREPHGPDSPSGTVTVYAVLARRYVPRLVAKPPGGRVPASRVEGGCASRRLPAVQSRAHCMHQQGGGNTVVR